MLRFIIVIIYKYESPILKILPKNETPQFEYITTIRVAVAPPFTVGDAGAGIREIVPITGGEFAGPRLNGKVIPGGADWSLRRSNGGFKVWARYTLRLDDETVVSILNAGLVWKNDNGSYGGRTVAEFEVADGPHAWLRESIFIGTLTAEVGNDDEVVIELWQVT